MADNERSNAPYQERDASRTASIDGRDLSLAGSEAGTASVPDLSRSITEQSSAQRNYGMVMHVADFTTQLMT